MLSNSRRTANPSEVSISPEKMGLFKRSPSSKTPFSLFRMKHCLEKIVGKIKKRCSIFSGVTPCEKHPVQEPLAQKETKSTPDDVGYVINSNGEYLEAVAKQYSRGFGKEVKVYIKVQGHIEEEFAL